MVSEANEPGSESGKRSDDRRGVPEGTPQEEGASTPLAAPGSFAAAAMIAPTASARGAAHGIDSLGVVCENPPPLSDTRPRRCLHDGHPGRLTHHRPAAPAR